MRIRAGKSGERAEPDNLAPPSIGFRLSDVASRRLLGERAAALGVSPHDLARQFVLQSLEENQPAEILRQSIRAVQRELTELREDIALATEALLVSSGKVSEVKARTWVDGNFRPHPAPQIVAELFAQGDLWSGDPASVSKEGDEEL